MKVLAQLSLPQQLTSTVATGSAPLIVASTTLVTNLNADLLDGLNSSAFALASHGNHVPTLQVANNSIFLRNDNTWQTVTPANIGAQPALGYTPVNKAGDTISGLLTVSTSVGESLVVNSSHATDSWLTIKNATLATTGYLGFWNSANAGKTLVLQNQTANGSINLSVNGTGVASVNNNTIWHAGNLTKVSQLTNDSAYLTGITSAQVTGALGYTPVSKAGDTMTGELKVSKQDGYITSYNPVDNYSLSMHTNVATGFLHFFNNGTVVSDLTFNTNGTLSTSSILNANAGLYSTAESRFSTGAYTDPWNGVSCSLKASGNVGVGGALKVNAELYAYGNIIGPYGIMFRGGVDEWLRINDQSDFANGIYCGGGILRTDGTLQVGNNGAYLYANSSGLAVNGRDFRRSISRLYRYDGENDFGYYIDHHWTGNASGWRITAHNDGGDEQAYIHRTSVNIADEVWGAGMHPASSWSGTIPFNTAFALSHNLGYKPIVNISGTTGNVNVNYSHRDNNTVDFFNWNTGSNGWSGTIYFH